MPNLEPIPATSGRHWLRQLHPVWLGALVLAVLYTGHYLGHPALPGNNPRFPAGWWGWFDQSKYLQAATAFAHFDLSPAQHYYPPGYALLGAIFVRSGGMHPFFFVDLAALLVGLVAFVRFARSCGVGRAASTALFVLATAADPVLFAQWVAPWTTTPLAAVLWVLLAVAASHLEGKRRPLLLGLLCACLPILRPTDLLLAVPVIGVCLAVDLRKRRLRLRDVGAFAAGVLVPTALYAGLYLRIYGLHLSEYLVTSATISFSLHALGWKAYVVLVDPRAWFGSGEGLLRRAPWMILGIAGCIPAFRRPVTAVLALALILHSLLYLSYIDLLPTNLWRYMTVRYWTWSFPGFALLGFLLLRDLGRRRHRVLAAASLATVLLLLLVHYDPAPAGPGQSVDALDFAEPTPSFESVFFGTLAIDDAMGAMANVGQIRAVPMPGGVRVLALVRPFSGAVHVAGEGLDAIPAEPIHAGLHFGLHGWRGHQGGDPYGPQ